MLITIDKNASFFKTTFYFILMRLIFMLFYMSYICIFVIMLYAPRIKKIITKQADQRAEKETNIL